MTGIDFDCAHCGTSYEGTDGTPGHPWPALGFRRPDPFLDLDEAGRRGAQADDDLCVIHRRERTDCFLRANLSVAVTGEDRFLEYGPWAQVDEACFSDYVHHVDDPLHARTYVGTLATAVPGYREIETVPVRIRTRGLHRPEIIPDPTFDHLLVRDYYDGITRAEAELRIRSFLLTDASL